MILKADSALNGQHRAADTAKYRLLNEWNATQVEYPKDACLHRLFEAQAERTPDAIAVEFEERHLTFRELEQRANQLAHHLQGLGIGPETIVGVYMERSLEMIVSLYGILKAGGAYVPMDPEYPHDRIAFMLEDTRVPVLLTQKHLSPDLPPSEAKILCLDAHWPIVEKEPTKRTISEVSTENLAYVIYTSGSTGKPKGVMNCHSGICNRLFWMQDEYNLTEADRVLQKTPFSFDVSVWEFFWPLLFGARLIVAKPGGHRDSNYLIRLINEKAITTLHFVPSMLQIFLDDPNAASCCSLKRVICSGEALTYELQERFFTTLDAELHNLYGPTEAAVDVTYWACERGTDLRFVPIGRPVANTQMYVLDANLQPVPVGEPGELHIGGIQVARGYLNRPELTAEKFIPDPFRSEPGTRLYKTGDLGCYLPNGAIKYLGRIDHQVKIRGIRIELGEIESVLEAHPAVKLAIVAVNEERAGDKRLVAYLVANPRQSISIPQLRAVLEKELPESMIPSVYIQIDEMPLSPNGKVDRRALPAPGNQRPQLDQAYIPPRNKLEHYLADLWCDILKIEKIGIYDRFFELGGNSLNAAQFINRLQTDLGENIYIVSVFEAPTIAEYADFVKRDYTEAIAPKMGKEEVHGDSTALGKTIDRENQKIDREAIFRMYACIPHLPPRNDDQEDRPNPSAIFILAPPRSGTTLLRVMLAGHPDLFAASELQLLGFNTLAERRNAYTGKFSLWLEGTIRAIMEMKGCSVDDAYGIMDQFERQNATTKQFYRALQDWIGDKILVDKSPSYVLDPATLQKAERDFDNPLYIHLVRHPYATVRSFLQYHMDQVLYLKRHEFRPRQLAELVWLVSHQNAVEFLQNIPSLRHCQILFEDLVKEPEKTMRCLCQKFGIDYHLNLIDPYRNLNCKMADGIYKESKPMGDTHFLEHRRINPKVAENWTGVLTDNFLSDMTWQLAISLGYPLPDSANRCDGENSSTNRRQIVTNRRSAFEQIRKRRQKTRFSKV